MALKHSCSLDCKGCSRVQVCLILINGQKDIITGHDGHDTCSRSGKSMHSQALQAPQQKGVMS